MAKPKRIWTDGLKAPKTETNPKGGGRVKGRDYSHLSKYPGSQAKHRLSYSRMKAQAKYRNEEFILTWEEYQNLWEGKWHLRTSEKGGLCLTRKDWKAPWSIDNITMVDRETHWARQGIMRPSRKGIKRGPYRPRKPKV